MEMRLNLLLLFFYLVSSISTAQSYIDIVDIGFQQNKTTTYADYENTYDQQTSWLSFNLPKNLKDKGDLLIPNLTYNFTQLHHDVYPEEKLNFHALELGIGWGHYFKNPYWASYINISTAISSDLGTVNETHFNKAWTTLFYYGKKESLVWNFGFDYYGGSFGHWLVPLVGLDWRINEKINLSFQTFSHLQVDFKLTEKFYGGVLTTIAPFSFNLSDYYGLKDSYIYTYSNDFPYAPQQAFIYGDFYLKNELVLFGKIGYEFAKTIYHSDQEGLIVDNSAYNGAIDPGLVFEIGFAWRKEMSQKFNFK